VNRLTFADGDPGPERRLVDSVRRGVRTAEAITGQALQALRDSAYLNILVGEPIEEALSRAREIDQARAAGRPLGPLAGLPVVVKDNIAIAGRPLTGASPALRGYWPSHSAGSVSRLVDAGAVVVGQTNMHELALGVTSGNGAHGSVRNPSDSTRMSGGSSGGTAAAVAVGAVPAGLATDTGGSGRIPAAWCGIVGFRPSAGRYPSDGVLNLSRTMDSVTAMTRSLDGLAMLDGVLTDDTAKPTATELAELRLGVPHDYSADVSAEISAGVADTLARFRAAGVVLVPVDLGPAQALNREIDLPLVAYELVDFWTAFAADELGCDLPALASRLVSPDVAERFAAFAATPRATAADYAQLLVKVASLKNLYRQMFGVLGLDAVVFPTVPVTAPPVDATTVDLPSGTTDIFQALTSTETLASLAGLPALTVPAGQDHAGLPFGLEFDGPAGSDRHLIAVGRIVSTLLPPPPDVTAVTTG